MRTRTVVGTAAVAAMALLASACSGGSDGTSAATTSTVPPGAPAEVAAAAGDWVLPGHDYDNSRAAVSTIDAANVRSLAKAWSHEVSGSLSTVPLIVGDTVYLQDGSGRISALDRATGDPRWESEAYGLNIGPFGVAVADGRVFGMHGSKGVVALDAATGRELWVKDITATPTTGIDIQPTVYDGLVLVSTVPVSIGGIYKGGDRGIINALDAATGEVALDLRHRARRRPLGQPRGQLRRWGLVPALDRHRAGPGALGHRQPGAVPGTPEFPNGSSRPGDNLYTDSAVALDVQTGELRWFHQVHPHDLFDRDLVHTLIARPADGPPIVVATGKGGVLVGLDRTTGDELWRTPVGHPRERRAHRAVRAHPGRAGHLRWRHHAAGHGRRRRLRGRHRRAGHPRAERHRLLRRQARPVRRHGGRGRRHHRRRAVVDRRCPAIPSVGVVVVNDLVLTATLQGTLVALDRASGDIVWQETLPGGVNGWMTVAGDLLVVPVGSAEPAQVVAFRLR